MNVEEWVAAQSDPNRAPAFDALWAAFQSVRHYCRHTDKRFHAKPPLFARMHIAC